MMMGTVMQRADAFIDSLTCRVQKPYPSAQIPEKNQAIADMLLNAFADGGSAEMTAVSQYINHSDTIKDKSLADMVFCIALVEMKHLDLVGTMIDSLGGDLRFWRTNRAYWSGGEVDYGQTDCEKISLDIQAEEEALSGYEELLRSIRKTDGPGEQQVEQVILRIMEDEAFHLQMFENAYARYCSA